LLNANGLCVGWVRPKNKDVTQVRVLCRKIAKCKTCDVVPLPFWHELNYFLFCQKFEKLFIICVEILVNLKVQLSNFESQTLHDNNLKLKQPKHIRLFHTIDKTMSIIF
jgi:hypothetical protein